MNKTTDFTDSDTCNKYNLNFNLLVVLMAPHFQASKLMVTFPGGNMRVRIPSGLLRQKDHYFGIVFSDIKQIKPTHIR